MWERKELVGAGTRVALLAVALALGCQGDDAAERRQAALGAAIRFAVIGDFGDDAQPEADVAALVKGWAPEFIITTGDNNYDVGAASTIDANIGKHYREFIHPYLGAYGPGATENRFFPSLGNHDWGTAGAQPYLDYFTLPGNERYYELVRGPVHFFAIDADPHEPDGTTATSAQATWLRERLAASTARWKIVYMHHAPYSSGASHGDYPTMQWPYAEWGASAVITGHEHVYERILRDGLPYFINGLGGRRLIHGFKTTPTGGSVVRFNADYGAMKVEADEDQITFRFYTRTGVLVDSYALPEELASGGSGGGAGGAGGAVTRSYQDGVAPTTTYAGTRDAMIAQNAPTANAGAGLELKADGDEPSGTGKDAAALFRWDLSDIPPGSTVTNVYLTFNVTNATSTAAPYELYELKRAWTEAQVTWQAASTGTAWAGAGATAAADRGAVVGETAPGGTGALGVTLNAAGRALVQRWIADPATNFGVILADSANSDGLAVNAREATVAAARPRLTVTYTPPAPATEPDGGAGSGGAAGGGAGGGGTGGGGTGGGGGTAGGGTGTGGGGSGGGGGTGGGGSGGGGGTATPTTVSLQDGVSGYAGTRDTQLEQAAPTANRGALATVKVDGDNPSGSGQDVTGLLRFDLTAIPAGSTISAASLTINVTNASTGEAYELYELLRAWDEGAATWNQALAGTAWGAAGAGAATDRATAVLGTAAPTATGALVIPLNVQGLAAVKRWIDFPAANFGFAIADPANADGLDFSSSEDTTIARRPKLTVTYTPPSTPGTGGAGGGGTGGGGSGGGGSGGAGGSPPVTATRSYQDGVAPTALYAGTRDTGIVESAATTPRGTATTIKVDGDDPSGTAKDASALLRWDLAGIPVGATVSAASITVNVTDRGGPYQLYELKRAFDEAQATWNVAATAVPWASAGAKGGADRGSVALGTMSASATGKLTVTLNADGRAAVKRWIDNPASNFGIVVANTSSTDGLIFTSREGAAADRPKLTVTYTTP